MHRVKDHICFAVSFIGLGYIVLWMVTAPLILPPGIHLAGLISTLYVAARSAWWLVRRARCTNVPAGVAAPVPPGRLSVVRKRPPGQSIRRHLAPPQQPARWVRPRSEFGLRGPPP